MNKNKYKKVLNESFSIGVYPTLELLKYRLESVTKILITSNSNRNKGVDEIKRICTLNNIHIEVADGRIRKIAKSENTYAVGIFNKYTSSIKECENHLVLVNPSDMGNMGTIIRSMRAFEMKNLAIIRPAVDIFDPKVIRASMGSVFGINFSYFNSFEEYKDKFSNKNYLFMTGEENKLNKTSFEEPFSLVFGNEGSGLPDSFKKYGDTVEILQSKDVDSLNLSIAVSIALYTSSLK